MITDEEMQKALETVKKYCDQRRCLDCNFCRFCGVNIDEGVSPCNWEIKKDED